MDSNIQHSVDMYTWKSESSVWASQLLWPALAVVEVLLGIRFLLKLFGADSFSSLQDFVYSITGYLLLPFTLVSKIPLESEAVFEWITLLSMVSYWLLFIGFLTLSRSSGGVSRIEIARALSKKKYGRPRSLMGRE